MRTFDFAEVWLVAALLDVARCGVARRGYFISSKRHNSGAFWKCLVVQGSFWWDQVRLFFFHANIKVGSGPAWFGSAEMCMARSGLAIFFMRTTWFGYVVAGFFRSGKEVNGRFW